LTLRDVNVPLIPGKATTIVGMRRCGKTYLCYQEMKRLQAQGVERERMLYVNLADDRLRRPSADLLDGVLLAFYRQCPRARDTGAYLFFDEIQNVEGWELFVRRVLDTENVQIYLTGSSSKMLSTEVATELRGRGISLELLPFSFAESVRHAGISVPRDGYSARERSEMETFFDRSLHVGGFPEVQTLEMPDRVRVLQDYAELVLMLDVAERHRISNTVALRWLVERLLDATASEFSVNRFAASLKSEGVRVGKDTLHEYLRHLTDAFLVFTVEVRRRSYKARMVNPRKVYAVDPGLAWAMSTCAAQDVGARLETAVYLELRRRLTDLRHGRISYHRTASGRQIDFVVDSVTPGGPVELIQVCANMGSEATIAREVAALEEA
ncbi:MAG: ATP-binding protein, partial [Actinomycetota bacterium]|nr:ATP-binding protein [Actinomycetota bacterium]